MHGIPGWMISPIAEFAEEHEVRVIHGADVLSNSRVAVVGLARNCGGSLQGNLERVRAGIASKAKDWSLFICENDSTDNTKEVISNFVSSSGGKASAKMCDLGRKHRPNEFAGPRTDELAQYRSECQSWVRDNCQGLDYVIVIDWDAWGGWTLDGVMSGFSYVASEPDIYGSASVSLLEHECFSFDATKNVMKKESQWVQYDCWALRLNSYWDDYSRGVGAWKHTWIPPVGSPPVRVKSAFGGFCIYEAADYLRGTYSGQDCEHVTFHRTIETQTGKALYLNPSQRTIMKWIETDADGSPDRSVQV